MEMKQITNEKPKKQRIYLMLSGAVLLASFILLVVTYAWFIKEREMSTAAWVKTPIILDIGAGNRHAIKYLDMGNIDVSSGNCKDYVICVYGKPVDNYSLQLAYTTNIAFHYDVYRAEKVANETDTADTITAKLEGEVEKYRITDFGKPVISGLSMKEVKDKNLSPAQFQSHKLSYVKGSANPVAKEKVQGFNEPFYFLAQQDGISVMRPVNINPQEGSFLDYYVIRVSWNAEDVKNDKETDIVCISASR